MDTTSLLIVVALIVLLVGVVVYRSVKVIEQATAAVIERLGKYRATAPPGLAFLVPFMDKIRALIDLREQVVSFPPQPVITQDNLTVSIDTVVYFQVTDPKAAVYEISNYIVGVEQLTTTTLRNVVGGMSLEETLTSVTRSTVSCAACWTRRPAAGGSGWRASSSRPSTHHRRSRSRWNGR